ncbi:fluoride efflux transporter CrcB [Nocardia thailandica]
MTALLVSVAGSLGALARFVVDGAIRTRRATEFPWATVVINVTGSLLLGFLTGLVLYQGAPHTLQVVAGIGFCGGYTTFSTASAETVRLIQRGRYRAAAVNALGTLALTLAAAGAGLALATL